MNPDSTVRRYLTMFLGEPPLHSQAGVAGGQSRVIPGGKMGHSLPMLLNSVALIVGRVSTMALGFLAWLLAARLYTVAAVGLASAAVSAMMLCVLIALLGVGSAVITLFPRHQRRPSGLLNTAFGIVAGAALVVAGAFLLLASSTLKELIVVAAVPPYAVMFMAMSVLGTVGVLFDHISIALRRSDQVLVRNLLSRMVTLALIGTLPILIGTANSRTIFSSWVAGGVAIFLLGSLQLRRSMSQYSLRPLFEVGIARELLVVGLPNYALTLTMRAPGYILPIVVIELLSAAASAHWYVVWMMAWLVFIIPFSVGQMLFAEAAHRPKSLRSLIRQGIRSSLVLGVFAAIGVASLANLVLSLLGGSYAVVGATPLRILLVAILPVSFIQVYFATCRATQRLPEAILTGVLSGLITLSAAAMAGMAYGLSGMAITWVGVQFVTGAWAVWRLRSISNRAQPESGRGNESVPAGDVAVPGVIPGDSAAS